MINFPKPLDWFQQKLWRLYWVEWTAIFFIQAIVDKNLSGFDFITIPIAAGLMMTFVGKYFAKFFIGLYKAISLLPGLGIIHFFAEILELLLMTVVGTNYKIISIFSEEKLEMNPLGKYAKKMGWNKP